MLHYKNRIIKIREEEEGYFFGHLLDKKGDKIGQIIAFGETFKKCVKEIKRLIDRSIHYNGY